MTLRSVLGKAGFIALLSWAAGPALGAENPRKPHDILHELDERMHTIGETTGSMQEFSNAEQKAANAMLDYLASGVEPDALVAKQGKGLTPLWVAALSGYAQVVEALLKSELVRQKIDEPALFGPNAWVMTNFAYRQAVFACHPTLIAYPEKSAILLATQAYYLRAPESPYRKIRRLLEAAGARPDREAAKKSWLDACVDQVSAYRARVRDSVDLLDTVIEIGAEVQSRLTDAKLPEER